MNAIQPYTVFQRLLLQGMEDHFRHANSFEKAIPKGELHLWQDDEGRHTGIHRTPNPIRQELALRLARLVEVVKKFAIVTVEPTREEQNEIFSLLRLRRAYIRNRLEYLPKMGDKPKNLIMEFLGEDLEINSRWISEKSRAKQWELFDEVFPALVDEIKQIKLLMLEANLNHRANRSPSNALASRRTVVLNAAVPNLRGEEKKKNAELPSKQS